MHESTRKPTCLMNYKQQYINNGYNVSEWSNEDFVAFLYFSETDDQNLVN